MTAATYLELFKRDMEELTDGVPAWKAIAALVVDNNSWSFRGSVENQAYPDQPTSLSVLQALELMKLTTMLTGIARYGDFDPLYLFESTYMIQHVREARPQQLADYLSKMPWRLVASLAAVVKPDAAILKQSPGVLAGMTIKVCYEPDFLRVNYTLFEAEWPEAFEIELTELQSAKVANILGVSPTEKVVQHYSVEDDRWSMQQEAY